MTQRLFRIQKIYINQTFDPQVIDNIDLLIDRQKRHLRNERPSPVKAASSLPFGIDGISDGSKRSGSRARDGAPP